MSQADSPNTTSPSRRTVLAGISVAAVSVAAALEKSGATIAPGTDPVFAVIEAHQAAGLAFGDAVSAQSKLEKALPRENRRSHIRAFEEEIVETDDPRWIASQRAVHDLSRQASNRALDLLAIRPTTRAGLVALFRHVAEAEEADLPSDVAFDDDERSYSFEAALLCVAADWLEEGDALRA